MKRKSLISVAAILLMLLLAACAPQATPKASTVQVKMGEFYFKPETIQLKAGQQVKIELVNEGKVEHEFMIGREVKMHEGKPETFEKDFFAGIEVTHTEEEGKFMNEPGHGTEVELEEGGKAALTFIVPADRKGEWEIGCFVPGHYEAGMKGKLVVE